MQKNTTPCYYGDYLQLDKILTAQAPESAKYANEAHDETLFIIVHQVYELWFKQILHELEAVLQVFAGEAVKDEQLTGIVHKLKRIITIQQLLNQQIGVMETMTAQDFMSFRDYLVPASGFQSIQFKMLEIGLGLKSEFRIDFDKNSFYSRLNEKDRNFLQQLEHQPSLFERIEKWLERMPFLELDGFSFWQMYQQATAAMLANDKTTVQGIVQIAEHERQQQLADLVLRDPAVASLSSFIGVDGSNPTLNTGRLLINLKPHKERDVSAQEVIRRLQPQVAQLPGSRLYLQAVQDLSLEDRITRTQYQLSLQDPDMDTLRVWAPKLLERLQQLPELADVASDLQDQGLQAYLQIDRDQAARLGVSLASIDSALYNAFGQRLISTIFTQSSQYRVVLEVAAPFQLGPQSLEQLYVPSADGSQVRLSTLAKVEQRSTLLAINHSDQFPAATLSFNLAPDTSLSEAVSAIRAVQDELQLPPSMQSRFRGAALAFEASLSNTLLLILAAIVTMYIVLGILYESFIHPITILSTLPSAGVGALLALMLAGQELGMVAVIGIILLIGIVKKNAILIIDFALEAQRQGGKSAEEAIYQACLQRFRPILMTTLAALLGALPLMFASGSGAELRQPLGITLVGGLLLSQVLTLFTTPVIYLAFDRLAQRVSGPRAAQVSA